MKRLVIDPGHGGDKPGVVFNNLREADATLATALTLKYVLAEELNAPFEIAMTRAQDVFTPFNRRTGIPATLLISIHYDIEWGAKPMYWQQGRCDSYYVARRLVTITGFEHPLWETKRAAHTGGRLYIDDANHPAVLWEVDTINHYEDSKEYRLSRARPMAKALIEVMEEL